MALSFVDRYALSMLITPIKRDLGFSDAAIGLLTGFAFSAFYSTFGIIMARISDRGAYRAIIVISLLFWSAMTAFSGAARSFWQMVIFRFGIGAGEAGVAPTSHALIAGLFSPQTRSGALATFSAAGPLGILIAFAVTAHLEAQFGWRLTFVILSLPGPLLALLFLVFGRRIIGRTASVVRNDDAKQGSWRAMLSLFGNRRFRVVSVTIAMTALLTFGQTQWLPAYLERSFALPRKEVGALLAATQGIGMLVGMLAGGVLFDRMARLDERWRTRLLVASFLTGCPAVIAIYAVRDGHSAAWLAALSAFLLALPSGQLWAEVQTIAPPGQRATGAALSLMISSFVGLGLGPLMIGWLSDLLAPRFANESLRAAMLITLGLAGLLIIFETFVLARLMRGPRGIAGVALAME